VAVSIMLSCIVTDREATYVLVFVEDVERFDGRHVVVQVVRRSSLRSTAAEIYSYTLRNTQEVI
jgi:hypothetical protein